MRPLAVVAVRRGRSPDLRGLYRVGALRARLEPRLQARLDEFVQVTVENFLRIRALDAGAQVLDAALVEHVVADLAAPADVGLVRFERVRSEEHTSELQSLMRISYAVFCLKKKK